MLIDSQHDSNFFIIKREMDKFETNVLFEHTKKLRTGNEKLILEPKRKENAYAFYRKRDRSTSRPRKIGILGDLDHVLDPQIPSNSFNEAADTQDGPPGPDSTRLSLDDDASRPEWSLTEGYHTDLSLVVHGKNAEAEDTRIGCGITTGGRDEDADHESDNTDVQVAAESEQLAYDQNSPKTSISDLDQREESIEGSLICDICQKAYNSLDNLQRHNRIKYPRNQKVFGQECADDINRKELLTASDDPSNADVAGAGFGEKGLSSSSKLQRQNVSQQLDVQEIFPNSTANVNIAPFVRPGSPSTRKSRFALATSEPPSRPLTSVEAWSLYHFEIHARECKECYGPLEVHQRGKRLCDAGDALARDVVRYIYYRNGEIYSKTSNDHKLVRVELRPNYTQTCGLLRAVDRATRSAVRSAPIISFDAVYPASRQRLISPTRERRYDDADRKETVYIEPDVGGSARKPLRRGTPKSNRKDTDKADLASSTAEANHRRESLYDTLNRRQKKDRDYIYMRDIDLVIAPRPVRDRSDHRSREGTISQSHHTTHHGPRRRSTTPEKKTHYSQHNEGMRTQIKPLGIPDDNDVSSKHNSNGGGSHKSEDIDNSPRRGLSSDYSDDEGSEVVDDSASPNATAAVDELLRSWTMLDVYKPQLVCCSISDQLCMIVHTHNTLLYWNRNYKSLLLLPLHA